MSNHFIRITGEGGYLGRWFWGNTGSTGCDDKWGSIHWLSNTAMENMGSGWAGSVGILRYFTLPTRR
jgi:hypothetical protein